MNISRSYTIRFVKTIKLSNNTYSFYFRRPKKFDFTAGQYIRFTLPIIANDGRGSSRFFTISSPPSDKKNLIITTRIIKSEFKKNLLKLGDFHKISIFGPMGNLYFDTNEEKENIFIAGGIGVTPFYSMISDVITKNFVPTITLINTYKNPNDIVFRDELASIAASHPSIKILYTDNLQVQFLKENIKNSNEKIYYIVGPPEMVDSTKIVLVKMNIPKDAIKTEQFTGY